MMRRRVARVGIDCCWPHRRRHRQLNRPGRHRHPGQRAVHRQSTTTPVWVAAGRVGAETNNACLTGSTNTSQTPIPGWRRAGGAARQDSSSRRMRSQEGGRLQLERALVARSGRDVQQLPVQRRQRRRHRVLPRRVRPEQRQRVADNARPAPAATSATRANTHGGAAGLTNGYLGVGLDVYGNFTNSDLRRLRLPGPDSGQTPESVDVRGAGQRHDRLLPAQHSGARAGHHSRHCDAQACRSRSRSTRQSTPPAPPASPCRPTATPCSVTPIGAQPPVTETGTLPNASQFRSRPAGSTPLTAFPAAELRLVGCDRRLHRLPHDLQRQRADAERHAAGARHDADRQRRRIGPHGSDRHLHGVPFGDSRQRDAADHA